MGYFWDTTPESGWMFAKGYWTNKDPRTQAKAYRNLRSIKGAIGPAVGVCISVVFFSSLFYEIITGKDLSAVIALALIADVFFYVIWGRLYHGRITPNEIDMPET